MSDPTEAIRRTLVAQVNGNAAEREALEERHGAVYDTDEIREHFEVLAFAAPFMIVVRRSDGVRGSLMFQHRPRFYWGFTPT
jgi:hypothetical protein